MNLNFLYIWLSVMSVVSIAAPIVRKKRGQKPPETEEFMVAGFALGSAIALVKVLIKLITQGKLQADLDWDGTVALCLSSGLGIYLSLKEVIKLF
jgi:hypothetical protein